MPLSLSGLLVAAALAPAAAPPPDQSPLARFFRRFDANADGFISRAECPMPMRRAFARIDSNGDGKLSRDELRRFEGRLVRFLDAPTTPKGEINTPAAKGERLPDRLKVGDVAPDFSLPLVKGPGEVRLSSFRGKRPVVLIFASYT